VSAPPLTFAGFGGVTLAAEAFGNPGNPAVVLLHGGAQNRRSWREAAVALAAAGRYAITVDLRGHGQSDWAKDGRYDAAAFSADVRAILAQLDSRPVVVGASLGGYAALAAMGDGGEALASGLVLVDAALAMDPSGRQRLGDILRRHADGFATLEEAALAAQELSPSHRSYDPAGIRRQLRQDESGRYFWSWDPRFLSAFDPSENDDLERAAAGLKLPTLVMRGRESDVVTAAEVDRFRELTPTAEFVTIEDAGHLVAAERFDAFNAALLEFLERRVPRAPLTYESGSDSRTLRDALGCFGTGVVIVTTINPDGKPTGLTANSFTSVSLDPPLVLFCVAKTARSLPAFEVSDTFVVNVLHIGQQPDSVRFAKRADDRFQASAWETWDTGAPVLCGSLGSFECVKHAWHDGGDHVIIVGRVQRARFEPHRDPLLFFRGAYRRLHFF
jgi:flavin reductase (DIM6/NTAB) family NADH-FMN oxidoreductase RutF/pimeloyl-ACP methyl ester carboxylesterase